MFNDLKDKIDYEYDKFTSYLSLVSRPDIMSRSFEIACKQAIYTRLCEDYASGRLKNEMVDKLMAVNDVIDFVYHKALMKNIITLQKNGLTSTSWQQIITSLDF